MRGLPNLRVVGLMTLPPPALTPDDNRPFFARLRACRDRALAEGLLSGRELSMGTSDDYEAAIAEGATIVRIGTAIFGARPR
jgi:uncharacterized pyridoxal phosphate-containing UPF0001 family protein